MSYWDTVLKIRYMGSVTEISGLSRVRMGYLPPPTSLYFWTPIQSCPHPQTTTQLKKSYSRCFLPIKFECPEQTRWFLGTCIANHKAQNRWERARRKVPAIEASRDRVSKGIIGGKLGHWWWEIYTGGEMGTQTWTML